MYGFSVINSVFAVIFIKYERKMVNL